MTAKVRKSDLDAALSLILNNRKRKKEFLGYGQQINLKISNLCSRDPLGRSNVLCSSGAGRRTNTQQLLLQLKRSVLKHDWEAVSTCIDYLLNLNGKLLPVIWRAIFLVFFNHKNSTPEKLRDFLKMCLALRTETERVNFLKVLISLPGDLSDHSKKKIKEEDYAEFNWDYSTEEEEIL